jgi:hypothetical protein
MERIQMDPDAAQSEVEHLLHSYDFMSGKAPDGEPKLQVRLGLQRQAVPRDLLPTRCWVPFLTC